MFDWRSEVITSDPEYYRWTQWFFVQFFKHNLAYQMEAPVDFCPNCNTTLAREQVQGEDRHCERCGTPVIKKNLKQWLFRITNYAEELLDFRISIGPRRSRRCKPIGSGAPKAPISPSRRRLASLLKFLPPARIRFGA